MIIEKGFDLFWYIAIKILDEIIPIKRAAWNSRSMRIPMPQNSILSQAIPHPLEAAQGDFIHLHGPEGFQQANKMAEFSMILAMVNGLA